MGWLSWLGFDTDTDQRLGDLDRRGDRLAEGQSRRLAAFAGVLARVARADLTVTPDEAKAMVALVGDFGRLDEADASLVVDTAVELSRRRGASSDYLATRELKALMSDDDRAGLLRCLFAVSAADDSVSLAEEEEIRQIATQLGFEHEAYVAARSEVRDKREVLRRLPTR
jgi:uncharacterized tellurite resistance protein B-like protein